MPRAVFDACYADIHPEQLVFDAHRQGAAKLPALTRLFPLARMICCVGNPTCSMSAPWSGRSYPPP